MQIMASRASNEHSDTSDTIPVAGMVKDERHRTRGLVLEDGNIIELREEHLKTRKLDGRGDNVEESADERALRLGLCAS